MCVFFSLASAVLYCYRGEAYIPSSNWFRRPKKSLTMRPLFKRVSYNSKAGFSHKMQLMHCSRTRYQHGKHGSERHYSISSLRGIGGRECFLRPRLIKSASQRHPVCQRDRWDLLLEPLCVFIPLLLVFISLRHLIIFSAAAKLVLIRFCIASALAVSSSFSISNLGMGVQLDQRVGLVVLP